MFSYWNFWNWQSEKVLITFRKKILSFANNFGNWKNVKLYFTFASLGLAWSEKSNFLPYQRFIYPWKTGLPWLHACCTCKSWSFIFLGILTTHRRTLFEKLQSSSRKKSPNDKISIWPPKLEQQLTKSTADPQNLDWLHSRKPIKIKSEKFVLFRTVCNMPCAKYLLNNTVDKTYVSRTNIENLDIFPTKN